VNQTNPIPLQVFNSGGYDLAWSKLDTALLNTVMQAIIFSFVFYICIYLVYLQNIHLALIGSLCSLAVTAITYTFVAMDSSNLGMEGTLAVIPIVAFSSSFVSQLVCSYSN